VTRFRWFAVLTILVVAASSIASSRRQGPYSTWQYGPQKGGEYFPIAVWLQNPRNAGRYKEAGINLFVGLWKGPTEEQLAELKKAGIQVICDQNAIGLKHLDDPTIAGWMHGDEPDNAQPIIDPATGRTAGYGPCVPPKKVIEDYRTMRRQDPSRPVLLNLGQGVANDAWVGRGAGASLNDYEEYVKGADIVSFDVYPVAGIDKPDGENYLWYLAKGLDRLRDWTGGRKPIWNCIETTRISSNKAPTPEQIRSEVWMSLIHGSRGLIYFVHEFAPRFNEHRLLDDPERLAAVKAVNGQIRRLAPVLNSPTIENAVTVSADGAPVDVMVKRYREATYVFAIGMRNRPATVEFRIRGIERAVAIVEDEHRQIPIRGGRFADRLRPYEPRIYRIR